MMSMRLPSTLAWLVETASAVSRPEDFLATLGTYLIADQMPLAGGALTLAAPHPIIARRTWLWRAQSGQVIESLGFGSFLPGGTEPDDVGRDWLQGLGAAAISVHLAGATPKNPGSVSPKLGWALSRPLAELE